MRKAFFLALSFLLTTGLVLAQTHSNTTERKAKDQITLVTDTRVGTTMLKAGDYEVSCDREKITFLRLSDRKTVLVVPCKGRELAVKQANTEVHTALDKDGVRYLDKLLIGGSNIEHTFN